MHIFFLDSKVMNTEKELVKNDIQIIANTTTLLNTGSTLFSFEMPLPAGLPETIKCAPQINVDYVISSKMDYKKTSNMIIQHEEIEKPLVLARLPENGILAGENHLNSIDVQQYSSNSWCKYRVNIDKHSAALGSKLPIKLEVLPTVQQGIRVKQVFVQLIERRTVNSNTNQLCHFLYPAKDNTINLPQLPITRQYKDTFYYQIPDDNKLSHSTTSYGDFHVEHILLVSVIMSCSINGKFSTKTISFQTHIDLLDSRLIHCEPSTKLPPYDNYPISIEEMDKLNRHGFSAALPPSYEESMQLITA